MYNPNEEQKFIMFKVDITGKTRDEIVKELISKIDDHLNANALKMINEYLLYGDKENMPAVMKAIYANQQIKPTLISQVMASIPENLK